VAQDCSDLECWNIICVYKLTYIITLIYFFAVISFLLVLCIHWITEILAYAILIVAAALSTSKSYYTDSS
jgi:uncharacterized membrane protein